MHSPVQDASGVWRWWVSKVLHDERSVLEDIDHVANVDLPDLHHLLPLLVRWRGAEIEKNLCVCASLIPGKCSKRTFAEICLILLVYPANCLACWILAWLIYFRHLAFGAAQKSSQSWMNEFQRQASINFTIVKVLNESSNNIASECICE